MTSSISRSPANFWMRMFWAFCLYLVLELGLFVIVKQGLHATEGELAGPYLAFAVPGVIVLLLAWWLRKWEERGPSPRRLALGWGLSGLLFFCAVAIAFFYSGVELHLLNLGVVASFIVVGVGGVLIASFSLYHSALRSISARTTRNTDGTRPQ
jgi:drug/metabolite transporter (DMT)-like permease